MLTGNTRASATKPAAGAGAAASQTTELRRDQELQAATGTWFCPKSLSMPMGTTRRGAMGAAWCRECRRCGTTKLARPGDCAVLVNDDPWIGHVVLVLGPVSEGCFEGLLQIMRLDSPTYHAPVNA